jgi:HTH-type transcriptional regulator/antitoxin MqsA
MQFYHGMACPLCEVGILATKREDLQFTYKETPITIVGQEMFECPHCNEAFFNPTDERNLEKVLTDERRKIDGLLTSKEIKAIRKQFGMTQIDFAKTLRVSEKTFARYENGQATQGYAMDNLLRVLRDIPEAIDIIIWKQVFGKAGRSTSISSDDPPIPMRQKEQENVEDVESTSVFSTTNTFFFWPGAAQGMLTVGGTQ